MTSEDKQKAFIVDTKYFKGAKDLKNKIEAQDITIVNTHFHMDHTRGNKLYPQAYVISGICSWKHWDFDSGHSKRPHKVLKPGEEIRLEIGNENIRIMNIGSAHTTTDCIVYLEKRKIIIAGAIIRNKIHPMVLDSNCHIESWLQTLKKLDTELVIDRIIPGHGDISNKSILLEMYEYFSSIKNAINDPVKLKQIKNKYKDFKTIRITNSFKKTVNKI